MQRAQVEVAAILVKELIGLIDSDTERGVIVAHFMSLSALMLSQDAATVIRQSAILADSENVTADQLRQACDYFSGEQQKLVPEPLASLYSIGRPRALISKAKALVMQRSVEDGIDADIRTMSSNIQASATEASALTVTPHTIDAALVSASFSIKSLCKLKLRLTGCIRKCSDSYLGRHVARHQNLEKLFVDSAQTLFELRTRATWFLLKSPLLFVADALAATEMADAAQGRALEAIRCRALAQSTATIAEAGFMPLIDDARSLEYNAVRVKHHNLVKALEAAISGSEMQDSRTVVADDICNGAWQNLFRVMAGDAAILSAEDRAHAFPGLPVAECELI